MAPTGLSYVLRGICLTVETLRGSAALAQVYARLSAIILVNE